MKKIELYKKNLIEYEKKEKINDFFIKEFCFTDIDYIIGVLFLTQMNMYCKINNFTAHGYYVAYSLMILFSEIGDMFKNDNKLETITLCYFWTSLTNNIIYLKERINNSPTANDSVKKNMTTHLSKFMNEISVIMSKLISNNINYFNKIVVDDGMEIEKYKWMENMYRPFFLILLTIAKFFGSGEYKDFNLERLSEYYTNIFVIYGKCKNINSSNNDMELLDMFITYQVKLNTSLIELNLNSETLDEIINYLNNKVTENLSNK
jgi:hypothetical protein